MDVMAVNPVARVVAPRFWAGVVSTAAAGVYFQRGGDLRRLFGGRAMAGAGTTGRILVQYAEQY